MKPIIASMVLVVSLFMICKYGGETSADTQISVPTETTEVTEATEITQPTEISVEVEVTEPQYKIVINEKEATALAKMAWGEARGCSDMEIAATIWCVLNRVDVNDSTIIKVATNQSQFHGYSRNNPVDDRIYNLAVDVLTRWQMEKQGASPEEVGRVLPPEYLYFHGNGKQNKFRDHYEHKKATYWNWSYPNPYETEGS